MKRTPLRRVSKKLAPKLRAYAVLKKRFLEQHPYCHICLKKNPKDIHHKMGRGRFLLDVSTWQPLCRQCHDYVESNKRWARAEGHILYK